MFLRQSDSHTLHHDARIARELSRFKIDTDMPVALCATSRGLTRSNRNVVAAARVRPPADICERVVDEREFCSCSRPCDRVAVSAVRRVARATDLAEHCAEASRVHGQATNSIGRHVRRGLDRPLDAHPASPRSRWGRKELAGLVGERTGVTVALSPEHAPPGSDRHLYASEHES